MIYAGLNNVGPMMNDDDQDDLDYRQPSKPTPRPYEREEQDGYRVPPPPKKETETTQTSPPSKKKDREQINDSNKAVVI